MARTFIGKLVIQAVDQASAVFRRVAAATDGLRAKLAGLSSIGSNSINLSGLESALKAAGAAGRQASRDLSSIASGRGIAAATQDAARLSTALGQAQSRLAALRSEAVAPIHIRFKVDRSGLNQAQADTRNVRRNAQRPIVTPSGPPIPPSTVAPAVPHGGAAPGRPGPGYAGVVAGGLVTNRVGQGTRYAITQGAEQQREDARAWASGMTEQERAGIIGTSQRMTSQYPSIRQGTMQEVLREGYFALGGPRRGGLGKMEEIAPDLAAALVNLQTRVGPRAATDQLTGFMRAAQNLGFADDVPRLRNTLDAMVRAQAVEGREFNFRDLFTFARRSKSAGLSLSDDFLMNIAPALIADMTPASAGVALGTLLSRQVAGQNSRAADRAQREYGIRNDQGLVNSQTFVRNPFQWVQDTLVPALRAKGVNVDDAGELGRILPQLFRDQTAQNLINRMISQREEFRDSSDAYQRAKPNREAAEELKSRDPYVALAGATAQVSNAFAEVTKPIISSVIPALHSFAAGLNGVTRWIQANPSIAPYVSGAAVLGAGGAALAGTFLTLRGIGSALGLGGSAAAGGTATGVTGSAMALGTILRTLPIVGGILAAGSVAGGPIGETFKGAEPGERHNFGRRVRRQADAIARRGRDEQFGPLVTPEEQGPPMPPLMHQHYPRMIERRDQLQRQIEDLRAGGEPEATSPRGQMLSNLTGELSSLSARIAEAEAAVRQAGQSLGSATAQGVQSAGPEAHAAGASVGRQLMDGLRSAIGSIGGPGAAPAATPAPSTPSTPSPPGRARGGPVTAGSLYMVGEIGPELFRPAVDGSIIPNHQMASALSAADGGMASPTVGQPSPLTGGAPAAHPQPPAPASPPASVTAPAIHLGGIHIHAGQRMNPETIIQAVTQRLREETWEALSAALSDTEYASG